MHEHMRFHEVWTDADYPVPDSWRLLTGGPTTPLRSLHLRMPNCRYACTVVQ